MSLKTDDLRTWSKPRGEPSELKLKDGSRIGVIGGGPAGSFFSYFLLGMADEIGLDVGLDVFEPRDFSSPAPRGCNMCGGIISESLVQTLATEGINLPRTVIQRGIDSYMLHMDVGSVRIDTPANEMRIGAVHRGGGPRDVKEAKWGSFDAHLQGLAMGRGAQVIRQRVEEVVPENGQIRVRAHKGEPVNYDLVVVAAGANSGTLKLFDKLDIGYRPPKTTKTMIREYYFGESEVDRIIGNSMHVFLLNIPRLEFAAVIPKGDYVTLCLMGDDVDADLLKTFLETPEVSRLLPVETSGSWSCQCAPRMNVEGAVEPFADRLLFVGDCGVTRLYKDGIGAAYRTAKAAAQAAVFHGISREDFRAHYWPACRTIRRDNAIGKLTFAITREIQKRRFTRRAVFRMTTREQKQESGRRMSMVLWDVFTGSATYRNIFGRTLQPAFWGRLLLDIAASVPGRTEAEDRRNA